MGTDSICLIIFVPVMLKAEIKDKFRKKLRNGEPDGEIREQMQSEGYTKEEIDEVFACAPEKSMAIWYVVGIVVTFLYGIIMFKKESGLLALLSFFMSAVCIQQFVIVINKDKAKPG